MKASAKRNAARWLHIGVGSVIAAYIYSPLGAIPSFQLVTKAVVIPLTILSGIWLWKGHLLRKRTGRTKAMGLLLILTAGATVPAILGFGPGVNNSLILKITEVKSSGKLYVSFCTKPDEWSANGKYHFQYPDPIKGTNTYSITSIPSGTYAVAIFQDLNGNGKLDENMFGIPKEPFAFSNNIVPGFSAPGFEQCKFVFSKDGQELSIKLLD